MWAVAEVAPQAETGIAVLGGLSVVGWLFWFSRHILARTVGVDARQDKVAQRYIDVAFERESRMSAERDAALYEVRQERDRTETVRQSCEDRLRAAEERLRKCWEAHNVRR